LLPGAKPSLKTGDGDDAQVNLSGRNLGNKPTGAPRAVHMRVDSVEQMVYNMGRSAFQEISDAYQ
jgi:hypothetical protein